MNNQDTWCDFELMVNKSMTLAICLWHAYLACLPSYQMQNWVEVSSYNEVLECGDKIEKVGLFDK